MAHESLNREAIFTKPNLPSAPKAEEKSSQSDTTSSIGNKGSGPRPDRPRLGFSRDPQASIVKAPRDGPHPRRLRGSERKKRWHLPEHENYQIYLVPPLHPRRPWGSPIKEVGDCRYTNTSNMPKGHNTCKWLALSSTELCGKSCLTDFCKVHLVRLRKGSLTQPCRGCGVGVRNKKQLCCQCGYRIEQCRAARAVRKEFARLAAIEILI